jgi:hypothetical protein
MTIAGRTDGQGNPVSGPVEGVAAYDHAVDRLLRFHPDVVPAMLGLVRDLPDFPMGQVLAGYVSMTSTDVRDLRHVGRALDCLAGLDLAPREAAHRDALALGLAGDWPGAARRLDEVLVRWPADVLALFIGHQLDFFLGDGANLRDRVGRSFHALDPDDPRRAFLRGMYAFGLEESGHYEQARSHGLAALDAHPDDVWALHAVVHTYEMEGRVDDGLRFMAEREGDWGAGNLFTVHTHWHYALYQLEAEQPGAALATYDREIHDAGSDGLPIQMVDASALLWRLLLDGVDTGDRFAALADAWSVRAGDDPWYVFNDLHAVMALAGAGRLPEARAWIDRLTAYVATAGEDAGDAPSGGHDPRHSVASSARLAGAGARSNVAVTAEIGLPACRASLAYVEARYDDVLAELLPIRTVLHRFGGSHAQRDVVQRTIVDAARRGGHDDLAAALLSERLALRETSVYALRRLAELRRSHDDPTGAAEADTQATTNARRFAAAVSPSA